MTSLSPLTFAHISDTHIGPEPEFLLKGFPANARAARVVDAIEALPQRPDFVIHTGDVVADPDARSYHNAKLLFERLGKVGIPVRFVPGNHDTSADVRSLLSLDGIERLNPDTERLSYVFTQGGHRFVVLDAKPTGNSWCGALGDSQLAFLRSEVEAAPSSLTVFLHYPARPLGVPWIDQKRRLTDGDQLHELLADLPRGVVRGVFSGHVHRALSVTEDGVLYQSAGATSMQFVTLPGVEKPTVADDSQSVFSVVSYLGKSTVVQQQCV